MPSVGRPMWGAGRLTPGAVRPTLGAVRPTPGRPVRRRDRLDQRQAVDAGALAIFPAAYPVTNRQQGPEEFADGWRFFAELARPAAKVGVE